MKTYVRYGVILLAALIVGAILGIGIWYVDIDEIGRYGISFVQFISRYMLPIMIVLVIIHVVTGEFILKKIKRQGLILEIMPICMILALLVHLVWNTGIMAVAFIGIIWIIMTVTYNKNCLGM